MKKKSPVTSKDKKDWIEFTKNLKNIFDKDDILKKSSTKTSKIKTLDLHGKTFLHANKIVKDFILHSYEEGFTKLLIITGKGLRSDVSKNPYLSEKMSILKYSIPEFIKNDEDLADKLNKITAADIKDGGEGSIYVFLKKTKKLQNKF